MSEPRNVFVEFHVLSSYAPSNLNRDELGTPKTALFGGSRRLRISSQCLKRTWRTSEFFRGQFADDLLGVRTQLLPRELRKELAGGKDPLTPEELDALVALLRLIGKKEGKGKAEEEAEEPEGEAESAEEEPVEDKTAHLLFLSRAEMATVKEFASAQRKRLAQVLGPKEGKGGKKSKKGVDPKEADKLRRDLAAYLNEKCKRNAVDVALFGRFVTSAEIRSVDAAMQVAHALGTQKVEIEYDYFSAMDDLSQEPGAGHIGESEFASSVFYQYGVCDLGLLRSNLAGDLELTARALKALALAITQAVPRGKKNSTAPNSRADYLEVILRQDSPLSLANAFLKPVLPSGAGDVMEESIARLRETGNRYAEVYGADRLGWFTVATRGLAAEEAEDVDQAARPARKAKGDQPAQQARKEEVVCKSLAELTGKLEQAGRAAAERLPAEPQK